MILREWREWRLSRLPQVISTRRPELAAGAGVCLSALALALAVGRVLELSGFQDSASTSVKS
jgi:hypothetical protein